MANIKINNLKLAGADLFADDESFMNELVESEVDNIKGGSWSFICFYFDRDAQ